MSAMPRPEIGVVSRYDFGETCERLQKAAVESGFSILGVHQVSQTLRSKGFECIPITILEVCQAPMAATAIRNDPRVAVMMPCPIAIVQREDAVAVYTLDARLMASLFEGEEMRQLGDRMHEDLQRLIQTVG
ncbi:MAG: DUF302 domain-containing protein [Fimbriimonadales bacterium]|nr:DUF302 domain-containing protein [Fimbriimonadales bacterium]